MKINFVSVCPVPSDEVQRNEEHSLRLGFPKLGRAETPHLAVVGGGPSIKSRVDELRAFDGEIWAINGAFHFLTERGVDCAFYSVDPSDYLIPLCRGAERAVLATICNPEVFRELSGASLNVAKVGEGGLTSGPTSACTAVAIAIEMGFRSLTFYGCESSHDAETHAYFNPVVDPNRLLIKTNGKEYLTHPGIFMQAEFLAKLIRAAPSVFKERSGGLLAALVADPDYDVLAASRAIHDSLTYEVAA